MQFFFIPSILCLDASLDDAHRQDLRIQATFNCKWPAVVAHAPLIIAHKLPLWPIPNIFHAIFINWRMNNLINRFLFEYFENVLSGKNAVI